MKCFTFSHGSLTEGITVLVDSRLGTVVFLGEEGRGRWYEKVALFRKSPAEVVNGQVFSAHPVKFTLPATDGKPERVFWMLANPRNDQDERVLVRVNTSWVYTRNTAGIWTTVSGNPVNLVMGHGAHGLAGRIGYWDDGLVLMSLGDVLRIKPEGGYKTRAFALAYEWENVQCMPFDDYEKTRALAEHKGDYM